MKISLGAEPATTRDVVELDAEHIVERAATELGRLAGKRLLITGGAGFLGFGFIHALLRWNAGVESSDQVHVTVFDNYARGVPEWLDALHNDPTLELVQHDVTRPLPEPIPHFDFIIHAAGIASPTYYRLHPIETMDANIIGLRRLLDYAASSREVDGFLFFSSSEIYGDPPPEAIPTEESYRGNVSCTGPRACYDESKRFGETLCVTFARQFDLPIKIVRPFNNYGPGLKITDKRVIPDLARDVLAGRDMTLLSDGRETRTFCYVADAIAGYFKVLVSGRPGEAYNIGVESPELPIRDLAEKLRATAQELFGYAGRVGHSQSDDQDYLVDNPQRRCPSIAKARAELGYEPGISLDEGLRRSLLWYRDNAAGQQA